MQKVAIFYVVTGKYLVFWPDFLATAEQNLLPGCEVHYFVFTDAKTLPGEDGVCPPLSEKALAALGGKAPAGAPAHWQAAFTASSRRLTPGRTLRSSGFICSARCCRCWPSRAFLRPIF